jgi:tRNA pseudouridine38-40 synthase
VHARGQVVSFWTDSSLRSQTFVKALNYYLPVDIAVKAAARVDDDFNVRRDALSREYVYRILNVSTRAPLAEGFVYLVANSLNIEIMNKASRLLEGKHDVSSFVTSLGGVKNTLRTIYKAEVTKEGDIIAFRMVANSFLLHQVRNTVGLLIKVGLGKMAIEEFNHIIEARTPGLAGPAVPAYGLCLTKVNYPSDLESKYENLFN